MEELLKKYFKWVFTEDFFTVALDFTGCYLFTVHPEDEEVKKQAKSFRQAMHLKNSQCLLCVIGRKSNLSYCSWELLDSFAMQVTQKRKKVLTEAEIQSILDCYGVEKKKNNTVRQGEIKEEKFETQIRQPKQGMVPVLWVSLLLAVIAAGLLVGGQRILAIFPAVIAWTVSTKIYGKTESLAAFIVTRVALTVLIVSGVIVIVELIPTEAGSAVRAFFGERK